MVLKLFINYLSIKQKRVPFVFFFSGKMRFTIRVVGGSVRDAHNEGGKKGETEQSRVGTECDVFGVFAFIFIFRAHTPAGISHEKKGGKVESDE